MARWTVSDDDQTITIEALDRGWSIEIQGARFTTVSAPVLRDLRRKLGVALGTEDEQR